MITERESKRFNATKPYAELVASPQWQIIEEDFLKDIEETITNLSYVGFDKGRDAEHDALVSVRQTRAMLHTIRKRAEEHKRLKERLAQEEGIALPDSTPLAETTESALH